jgi:hypothetical protein
MVINGFHDEGNRASSATNMNKAFFPELLPGLQGGGIASAL